MTKSTMKLRRTAGSTVLFLLVTFYVCLILLPFVWQLLTSFKSITEISAIPAIWFPERINVQFYINVFTKHPFLRYMMNSLIVAVSTTFICIFIGSGAAYALGRLRFKGKKAVLMCILSVSMFPPMANLSPLFLLLKNAGLLNHYLGLIIPYITFSLPMSIWLLSRFFAQLPRGLEEAAALDGCGRIKTFFMIMLPLIKPAVFSCGLLVFINSWNEYIYALTFMTDKAMKTVPIGIALLPSNYELPWGDMAAASIVVTVPLIILVLLFQNRIISGLTTGGMKE